MEIIEKVNITVRMDCPEGVLRLKFYFIPVNICKISINIKIV